MVCVIAVIMDRCGGRDDYLAGNGLVCSTDRVPVSADDVIAQRLRTQRLTSGALDDAAAVVRLLVCVQAQDPPNSRFSLGMRTKDATDEGIRRAISEGRIIRTHILRPTWHYVAPDDLRWILDLTSPKVITGLGARHRFLGLDDPKVVDRALDAFAELLAGRRCLTRLAIRDELPEFGLAYEREHLGHLLLLAELRGLVCSGPLDGPHHTYALVDELVAPSPKKARDDAVRELVARFFAGHGPAAVSDLTRWTKLTQGEIKPAIAELGDRLSSVTVDGLELWFEPAADADESRPRRAFLLPLFDEAYLSYPKLNFPREGPTQGRFTEAGSGVVVCDGRDVGSWRRRKDRGRVAVALNLAADLSKAQRAAIDIEVDRYLEFGEDPHQ